MKQVQISHLLCNRLKEPIGFSLGSTPRFSWNVEAPADMTFQTRVTVSNDSAFKNILFDSTAATVQPDPICYPIPINLEPRTRYFWKITLTNKTKILASKVSFFETGKLNEPWRGKWITPDFSQETHPVLCQKFHLPSDVISARAYICGLGLYELYLNNIKAGDEFLSPGICAYDKWLPYQTYDVTDLCNAGINHIEISLGNGWYKGRYGLTRDKEFHYGNNFACIMELYVTCQNGNTYLFSTDSNWTAKKNCILSSSIFDGEERDDTRDCRNHYPVKEIQLPISLLQERRSPATKIMHRIKPVSLIHTPAGETVLDMGQNMTGWLSFFCHAKKGDQIHLQFGELLQDGNFYRENLRTAKAEYKYISDGISKIIRPQFTFYGFRYVKLTAWYQPYEDISLEDFTGLVLYSDMEETGSIVTNNPKINKLFANTLWGQRGNFLDIPTDCPQRDERMGWTGDAQVFFGTAAFNMDVSAFFAKYSYDLMLEQEAAGGTVPVVIPKHNVIQTGSCAWGDAATILPWNHYIRYGDKEILSKQYPSMKAWVDYILRHDTSTGSTRLWQGDFHYCDWLALDGEDSIGNRFGGTERTFLASCYYRHSAMLVSKAAAVLQKTDDADFYHHLSEEVRNAILQEYVTKNGRLAIPTQTAYILALHFDIMPEKWRKKTAYALRMKLKESKYHLRTGFIGTPYLCRVLSEYGSNDISYKLLLQEDFPSWLYEINMGATTIWERWNSVLPDGHVSDTGMNSMNHYSYGSIVEWMYRNAAGIQPLEEFPGFRKFLLAPQPDKSLGSLSASFFSPAGLIQSAWKLNNDGTFTYTFHIPYGSSAKLILPNCADAPNTLTPGDYTFTGYPENVNLKYTLDTPISELLKDPYAKSVLETELSCLTNMMLFPMMAGERSIRDFAQEKFIKLTNEKEEDLINKLNPHTD